MEEIGHEALSDRLIRIEAVIDLTGMSRRSVYRAIAQGKFPRSQRLSHKQARWSERDVAAWIEAQKAA